MKPCNHSQWLGLRAQDKQFQETDRLQTLVEGLPNPDTRYPSLLVLVGKKTKSLVLRELVAVERKYKIRTKRARRGIHLHLDASSIFNENPILYADCSLTTDLASDSISQVERCHESIKRRLLWYSGEALQLTGIETVDYLFARLLCPFSDVFCLFLEDLGGMQSVVERLVSWLEKGQALAVPKPANPSLVLVVESDAPGANAEREVKEELFQILEQRTPRSIFDLFFDVTVVSIFPEGKLSSQARHRRVKERLLDALDQGQERRLSVGMLFSATHFAVFFGHACDHFVTTLDEPFDFIKTSRLRNPVSAEMEKHLSRFLKHIRSPQELMDFAIPVVASSLLLNAYPPDMHVFKPRDVFHALYMDACRRVGRIGILEQDGSAHLLLPSAFIKLVEHQFSLWFEDITQDLGMTSAKLHLQNLQRFQSVWQTIRDNKLCLACLDQTPEHTLPCAHTMCEACIERYWNLDEHPWVFKLDRCLLCRSIFPEQATVKVRDPSRGLRFLCLDGGGVRGIAHLMFLKVFQDRIGLPYPVQENFDVGLATSIGAIVILAMYKAGLSVDDCIHAFEYLASRAFQRRSVSGIPFISFIEKIIVAYLEDGLYPPEGLEAALKQIFGDAMTMFDSSYATTIGTKIAVTVTTAPKSSPCVFRNYKKVGKRDKEYGYHVIQPQDGHGDPRVWQIARCASAAPGFFTPLDIPGVGPCQDGGPWKNNPVALVNPEIEAIAPLTGEPLIVSVGTGSTEEEDVPDTTEGKDGPDKSGPRKGWKVGFVIRNLSAYLESMNGKRLGQDYNNQRRMAPKEDYYRFDVNFPGRMPGLDNVDQIPWIKAEAHKQFSDSENIDILAYRFITSHFQFELGTMPKKVSGQYFGAGHILCDLKRSHPAYRALMNRLSLGAARFYMNGEVVSGKIDDHSFVDVDGNFRKRVEFESINGKLSITMETSEWEPLHVSGSPFSIEKRIRDQNLDAYFGQASHKKRKRLEQGMLPAKKRRSTNFWVR